MAKRKKYLFQKELYDKLLNWKETNPKQYWKVLNFLKKSNSTNKTAEILVNMKKVN
jgi:hypothetical protein